MKAQQYSITFHYHDMVASSPSSSSIGISPHSHHPSPITHHPPLTPSNLTHPLSAIVLHVLHRFPPHFAQLASINEFLFPHCTLCTQYLYFPCRKESDCAVQSAFAQLLAYFLPLPLSYSRSFFLGSRERTKKSSE